MKTKDPKFFVIILLIISTLLTFWQINCHAQKLRIQNLSKYDRQIVHFGFSLGINKADFTIRINPDIKKLDSLKMNNKFYSIYVIESETQSGFNLGIVSNLRLGPFFDLRFIPALSFVQRRLEYTLVGKNSESLVKIKNIESTFLEFPLELKYKSVRLNNGRAYVLGGVRFNIDLASQKDIEEEEEEDIIKLNQYDLLYEVGFGIDCYMKYFKFSPEIKLAFGINNMLVNDETMFSQSIDKLNSRILLVSFTFE
ncbi:MAG: porin family protein [Bacteroidota bacterium]